MKNLNIKFGGFYGSEHDEIITGLVNEHYTNEEGAELDYSSLDIPWLDIRQTYINHYMDFLKEYLEENHELKLSFNNISLDSPKFYNFRTDVILCTVSNEDETKVINLFKDDEDFLLFLEDATKSAPGFISFYTYQEALNNKDDVLINFIFDYIIEDTNADFNDEWRQYYDIRYVYELLNDINMPELVEGV